MPKTTCPRCGEVFSAREGHTCAQLERAQQLEAGRVKLAAAGEVWEVAKLEEAVQREKVYRLAVQLVYLGATKADAARLAGVSRPTLDKLMAEELAHREAVRLEALAGGE